MKKLFKLSHKSSFGGKSNVLATLLLTVILILPAFGAFAQSDKVPYVVVKDGTATFYYKASKPAGALSLQSSTIESRWSEEVRNSINLVDFDDSFKDYKPTSCAYWFCNLTNLTQISQMSINLNTEAVTDMSCMFYGCISLTLLDLGNFNTSNVERMDYTFGLCVSLETIFVGDNWSRGKNSNEHIFYYCNSLVGGKGTTYNEYDYGSINLCTNCLDHLVRIDGGEEHPGLLTKSGEPVYVPPYVIVDNGIATFYYNGLRPKDALLLQHNSWGGGSWAEELCLSITKVVFDESFKAYKPKSCAYWFRGFENLTEIVGMQENLNTEDVITMEDMFSGCKSLTTLDLSGFNTANVIEMNSMFSGCEKLETIYVGDEWTTDRTYSTDRFVFSGCYNLVGSKGTSFYDCDDGGTFFARIDGGDDNPGYLTKLGELKTTLKQAYAVLKDSIATFYYGDNKPEESLPLQRSFQQWPEEIQTSITKVVFDESFKSYKPKSCSYWFYNLTNLFEIEGMKKNLNTNYVRDIDCMFYSCSNLYSLDLLNFNTSKVEDMGCMFDGCRNLSSLDLSTFNTSNVTRMSAMFYDCYQLQYIIVGDGWSTETIGAYYTQGMFKFCDHLYGGKGTAYKRDFIDGTYAKIDGGESDPGYLTKSGEEPYRYVVAIAISTMPKTNYIQGEDLDVNESKLTVTYNNGETETIYGYYASFVGFDKNKVGKQTVKVIYEGCETSFTTPVSDTPTITPYTKVWSFSKQIFIESIPGSQYKIIDLNGRTITTSKTKSSKDVINLNNPGVYVVIVNGESFKVSLQ